MKIYWSQTRANGKPLESGLCLVTDLEDGTNPIYTYGATEAEISEKLAAQNAHAQLKMMRSIPAAPPPAQGRTLSADQIAQATADLSNPGKSPQAIATLLEAATGVSPHTATEERFGRLGIAWEAKHPEFYRHPGNRDMLARQTVHMAGSMAAVTEAHIDAAFADLTRRGMLFERTATEADDQNDATHTPLPGENRVQLEVRPRGSLFATSANPTRLSGSPTPAGPRFTPKFTREQIMAMPLSKSRELDNPKHPDHDAFNKACEYWFGERQATA